jgi:hypothetical protein
MIAQGFRDTVRDMDTSKLTITVETIHRGQPRPYADHYFEAIITYDKPFLETVPRAHSKALVEPWKEKEESTSWADARLISIEPIDGETKSYGVIAKSWRVKITRAYTG